MPRRSRSSPIQVTGVTWIESLALDSGERIAPAHLAWSRYGPEPARARAIVLLLHGISGSQQALAPVGEPRYPDAGWASGWLGQGAALDTRDTCVLVPNALGSCFGSSAPRGPAAAAFPEFTIADSVRLQACWLQTLGIERLDAVVGYSYGGYQAFQWALDAAMPIGRVLVLASGPLGNGSASDVLTLRALAAGLQAGDARAQAQWVEARRDTLRRYGYGQWLAARGEREPRVYLQAEAKTWAAHFSPWSLAALRGAACRFDVRSRLADLRAPVYWLRCASDALFRPDAQHVGFAMLRPMTVAGCYGHASPVLEGALWDACLRRALA